MELRQLRYALTVAEELHFGRAAERLHLAQPSLSRQIRDLEHSLGVRIFERTSRTVRLTPAGEAFIEVADRTLRMATSARATAKAAAEGRIGRVALGFVASAAGEILPPLIERQRSLRPQVQLDLREMGTMQQVAALHGGEIDIGLTRDLVRHEDFELTALFREPVLAAVPAGHPLCTKPTVCLRDLAGFDVVSLPRASAPRIWDLLSVMSYETGIPVNVTQEAGQYATILALVTAKMGVALVPASASNLRREGVDYLRLSDQEAFSEVQMVNRSTETRPSVREFLGVILDTFVDGDEAGTLT